MVREGIKFISHWPTPPRLRDVFQFPILGHPSLFSLTCNTCNTWSSKNLTWSSKPQLCQSPPCFRSSSSCHQQRTSAAGGKSFLDQTSKHPRTGTLTGQSVTKAATTHSKYNLLQSRGRWRNLTDARNNMLICRFFDSGGALPQGHLGAPFLTSHLISSGSNHKSKS